MKTLILIVMMLAVGFAGGFGYSLWHTAHAKRAAAVVKPRGYHCPMHPDVHSDHPGDCPICGMKMVPDEVVPEKTTGGTDGFVTIPTDKQQWIGLKTGVAEVRSGTLTIRAAGRIAVDETRVVRVQSRTDGWIEKVFTDFTGRLVRKGEPMLTLYSPELTASQQEYLLARRAKDTMEHSPVPGMPHYNASLVEVARERLRSWGLDDGAVEQLEKSGKVQRTTTIYAPADGFVMTRNAFPNQRVTAETELYSLADLSRVWVIADLFESDVAQIRLGQSAVVEIPYIPGRRLRAKISNILPQIDPQTRTLKVRLEVENPEFLLKPDLFVNVEIGVGVPARVSVPSEALIDTGTRQIVYLDLGEGRFMARDVEAGERFDGQVEILKGLAAGERIVVSGAFLVDSESRMKAPSTAVASPHEKGHQHD